MAILTELRILQLARSGGKMVQSKRKIKTITKQRNCKIQERKRWKELREIEKLLLKAEKASQIKL